MLSMERVDCEAVSKTIKDTMLVKGLLKNPIENAMMLHPLLICGACGT